MCNFYDSQAIIRKDLLQFKLDIGRTQEKKSTHPPPMTPPLSIAHGESNHKFMVGRVI